MWAFFGFTLSAASGVLRAARPDIVIATSPPLITVLPGWVAAKVARAPWVFEVRDLWPESAVTTGVLKEGAALTRLLYALEAWGYRSASLINALTPAFREDILKRNLAGPDAISMVPNGADLDLFKPEKASDALRRELGWGDKIVVMYAGAHGRANALGQLVEAAALLSDRPDILIACVGDGPERKALAEDVQRRGLTNIVFHGPQPKDRMPALVNACDIGAAVLQDNPTFRTVYPNKVFDYMACEKPTLLAIDGVARALVCDEARAGVFAKPEDARQLAEQIIRLADDSAGRRAMGESGRSWVLQNASREGLAARYLERLEKTVKEHAGPAGRARRSRVKRLLDLSVASAAILATGPALGAAALAVRFKLGSPVFFRQPRPGLDGKTFELLKLRTMAHPKPGEEGPEHDGKRLGRFGRFLRATSVDELPTLWNVLRGDMSLVGPRPLLMQYLPLYDAEQSRRHSVKPGVTGWAQVHGRNALTWREKFALDVWYVDHWSLGLDLKILAKTALKVFKREGIEAQGHATMPPFRGNDAKDAA
jgi:lipopolysaccharide/colanic/teichoic acid biosynthesis glycosyltransferase